MQRRHRTDSRSWIASHLTTDGRRNVRSGESANTLTAAGFRTVAVCPAHCVGGFVGGMFLGGMTGNGALGILLALFFAFLGFMLPDLFISFKARGRREEIRSELPDALDLLAVSVEAGAGIVMNGERGVVDIRGSWRVLGRARRGACARCARTCRRSHAARRRR